MENLNAITFTSFENEVFGEIRFVDVEGKPYAVGNDIATALGYARPRKAIQDHCKKSIKRVVDVKPQNGASHQCARKTQEMHLIPESDIYRLIMKSRLPQAEKFEAWVMEEVIPQIRATGGYIPVNQGYSEVEILSKAFAIAQRTILDFEDIVGKKDLKIKEQEEIITEQNRVIIEQTKDWGYYNRVIAPPKLVSSTDVAKDLGMTAATLHKILNLRGIIYKHNRDRCWKFYSQYQNLIPEFADYTINEYSQTLKWTEKGRRFIIELIEGDSKVKQIIEQMSKSKNMSNKKPNKVDGE